MPPRTRIKVAESWLDRAGPLWAALAAACASLPGLWLPFLADDWHLLEQAGAAAPPLTTYGYFRPLYLVSFWLDRRLCGTSAALFHATNLLWIAVSAALFVLVARRLTGEGRIAVGAGILYALHPYHVENAAWVAARGDPLHAVFLLLALLAYDRWRVKGSGLPVAAWLAFEAALLTKEAAVIFPAALIALGLLVPSWRPAKREIVRGWIPILVLAGAHFALLRPAFLRGDGRDLTPGFGPSWVLHLLGLVVGALLPVDGQHLNERRFLWAGLAAVLLAVLFAVAWARSGHMPRRALVAGGLFVLLLVPGAIGFEERFLFLPAGAFAVMMVLLLQAIRGRLAVLFGLVLVAGWMLALTAQWDQWTEAGRASERIVEELGNASVDPAVGEIVVANLPYRVREGAVAGDYRAALELNGQRALPVHGICWMSYPAESVTALAAPAADAIVRGPGYTDVLLARGGEPFFRFEGPRPRPGETEVTRPTGLLRIEPDGTIRARILEDPRAGRIAFVWSEGRLIRLF